MQTERGFVVLHYPPLWWLLILRAFPAIHIPIKFSIFYSSSCKYSYFKSTGGIISSLKPSLRSIGWNIFELVRDLSPFVKSWGQSFDVKTPKFAMLCMLTITLWCLVTCSNTEQLHVYWECMMHCVCHSMTHFQHCFQFLRQLMLHLNYPFDCLYHHHQHDSLQQ